MSSARDGDSEGVAGAHPGLGTILQTLIAVNLAIGVCFSLFLLGLPSDPEHAVVGGYSLERVLLISGILVSTIALAILTLTLALKRTWRKSLAERFFGGRGWARRYLPVAALLMLSLYITPFLFFPTRLEGLTADHYIRLAPYLLWPWALLASFALGSWYLGTRPRLHVDSRTAERIAVAGLFLVSFAARAPLSGYGLPYQSVWDEVVTYPRALELLSGRTILEAGSVPGYGRASYGDPLIYITAAGQIAGLFATLRTGRVLSINQFTSPAAGVASVFEAVHDSGAPLLYPRLLFALINSLTPILIYVVLRRYMQAGAWASIAGGLVYAIFSPDVIYYSVFIWPDAIATTLAVAASVCGMEIIRSRRVTWIPELVCGVLVGATVSVSIRYVSLIPLPFLALALAQCHRRWAERVGLMAVALILGCLATSPTLLVNLPAYLLRLTGVSWIGDHSLHNRVISLAFYIRGAFLGQGFGLVVLGLSLVGYTVALQRHRKNTVFLTLVVVLHLIVITPMVFRVTRHALALYPLAVIFAAMGLRFAEERFSAAWKGLRIREHWRTPLPVASPGGSGLLVFLLFLAVSVPKILQTKSFVESMHSFKPSQVLMAEYMGANLEKGARVALLEIVPFADVHLRQSQADVHRVGLSVTMDELRQDDYQYVIGTDMIGPEFGDSRDTIWVSDLLSEEEKLIELGSAGLTSRGYPVGTIALYLSRVPPLEPSP
jgi:hypothetical protein